jgi:uncharacterized protein
MMTDMGDRGDVRSPRADTSGFGAGVTNLEVHECLALLRTKAVGRLALVVDDHPEIFPVNYLVDHGSVVFRTADGTKLAALRYGADVAFEIDNEDTGKLEAWSVVIKGRAAEILGSLDRFEATDLPLFPWHTAPKPRFVRIEPVEITGRRFDAHRGAAPSPNRTVKKAAFE